jgi:membrane fusion protein, multidrug efflux system
VQRVPVRIALDPQELREHPLRVGLSIAARVDVRDTSGPLVTTHVEGATSAADAGDGSKATVDALIARIVSENGGGH